MMCGSTVDCVAFTAVRARFVACYSGTTDGRSRCGHRPRLELLQLNPTKVTEKTHKGPGCQAVYKALVGSDKSGLQTFGQRRKSGIVDGGI